MPLYKVYARGKAEFEVEADNEDVAGELAQFHLDDGIDVVWDFETEQVE